MNRKDFMENVRSFDLKRYRSNFKLVEDMRKDFVNRFSPERIRKMSIDEYVQGKGIKDDNFCYELERKLGAYGSITGATAHKFGIFYSKSIEDYVVTKSWDTGSIKTSFRLLANTLADLIENAKAGNMDEVRKAPFSKMVKGKVLSTYFPERYLSIFSEAHLDYFIHRLELDDEVDEFADEINKRQVLVDFKQSIPEMQKWPLHAFSYFLYFHYPKSPRHDQEIIDYLEDFEFDFIPNDFESIDRIKSFKYHGKGDYESQNRKNKELGERGEFVVMHRELKYLKSLKIRKKPLQVSCSDDSLGYDILSYNEDGSKKYIEVKATNSSPSEFSFFFTANELEAAKSFGSDYHVYVVFHPYSSHPVITDLGNPTDEKAKMHLIPVNYKLHLRKKN